MLEFSKIISAVKPRDRTDQYAILGALYSLESHLSPVTTRQVSDLLQLHIPKRDLPKNLSASLKGYTGYVDPVAKSPKATWRLMPKGLDRLRSLSGLSLAVPVNTNDFDSDVAFICALEHPELSALIQALGGEARWKDVETGRYSHVYRETELQATNGRSLRVISTAATSMGLTAAAIATTHLVLKFRPRLVVMVGIAAGARSGGMEFGDVLVADPSVDYNSGKIVEVDGVRKFQPDPYPIGIYAHMRSLLKTYHSNHPCLEAIRGRWKKNLPPRTNRLHIGPMGAADQVIDAASRLVEIKDHWRKLIGVEMETYGVYRACTEAPEPKPRFVSFKSVCDFAAEKSDSWQEYAAFTAAEFAVAFVKDQWNKLWPNGE